MIQPRSVKCRAGLYLVKKKYVTKLPKITPAITLIIH